MRFHARLKRLELRALPAPRANDEDWAEAVCDRHMAHLSLHDCHDMPRDAAKVAVDAIADAILLELAWRHDVRLDEADVDELRTTLYAVYGVEAGEVLA